MNKTKIDWADMTWNPVTGCLHECEYCYAKKIANRFGNFYGSFCLIPHKEKNVGTLGNPLFELNEKRYLHKNNAKPQWLPYPFGFKPTFHRYRLDEPKRKTKGRKIFVCSMADLFGTWIPEAWINSIFSTIGQCLQHTFILLTKNPKHMNEFIKNFCRDEKGIHIQPNVWLGVTAENQRCADERIPMLLQTPAVIRFVSIEPMLGSVDIIQSISKFFGEGYGVESRREWIESALSNFWVIIGAETGNRKGKVIPEKQWIDNIAEQCKAANVPVFMKESLRELMGEDFIQEFPWEVKS